MNFLNSCIQENSLNSDVLNSAINALDFLCMNKSIRLIVAEKDGVGIVVKILKSQDWNKELVSKCLRILSNLGSAKENVEVLINNKVHNTIVDILTVQKKEEGIILQCLKLIGKLAIDKPFSKIVYQSGFVHSAYEVADETPLKYLDLYIHIYIEVSQFFNIIQTFYNCLYILKFHNFSILYKNLYILFYSIF